MGNMINLRGMLNPLQRPCLDGITIQTQEPCHDICYTQSGIRDGCSLDNDRFLLIGPKGAICVISIQGHVAEQLKKRQRERGHIRTLRYFHILKDRCALAVSNSLGS